MVVVSMLPQMFGKLVDALGQQCDLHFRRAYITGVCLKLADDLRFCIFCYGHTLLQIKLKIGALWLASDGEPLLVIRRQPPDTTPCQVYHTDKRTGLAPGPFRSPTRHMDEERTLS